MTSEHLPLLESLHLTCLTPLPADGIAIFGCRLSYERMLTSVSLPENSNSSFSPSIYQ